MLYAKNPHLKLPPASTVKVMTVVLAMENLPSDRKVRISPNAAAASPSRAGLTPGAYYRAEDLVIAALVASSNDAAVALAEAAAGTEARFAKLMNRRAGQIGMKNSFFLNATGLPVKGKRQYSTAYDLAVLMRHASRYKRLDQIMGLTRAAIRGSDGRVIRLRAHNKMLWKLPKFVKGKTGWTRASRHTFVGTDYHPKKSIVFAMMASEKPWLDIERIANFGHSARKKR